MRAFAIYASPAGRSFDFVDRIPRERGLGSSAAVVALGLVAGAAAAGLEPTIDELLEAGLVLEGHADNLAPALAGGVCLTYDGRVERIADDLPAKAIAVVPETRVNTAASRGALPDDCAARRRRLQRRAGGAARRGTRRNDAHVFAAALDDRLHEPYRMEHAPHLGEIRADLPNGALGATLSGSGPTVIVWAERESAARVVAELSVRYPAHEVMLLDVSPAGAGALSGTLRRRRRDERVADDASTRSRLPSTTGTRPPSSRRTSSTRPRRVDA